MKTAINVSHFTGTEKFTRWSPLTDDVLTDGALYLAEEAGAFWLFDKISSLIPTLTNSSLIVSTLTVDMVMSKAQLTMTDGNENVLHEETISFTDFPLDSIVIWSVHNGFGGHSHMLPSEY